MILASHIYSPRKVSVLRFCKSDRRLWSAMSSRADFINYNSKYLPPVLLHIITVPVFLFLYAFEVMAATFRQRHIVAHTYF